MDTEYIEAMEYGMPPISGWGMGIDRLSPTINKFQKYKRRSNVSINETTRKKRSPYRKD